MSNLFEVFKQQCAFIASQKNLNIYVGYSGGIDSTCLLYLFAELKKQFVFNLYAIHINHNQHPDSPQWLDHCKKTCAKLEIPFYSKTIAAVHCLKNSPENHLRTERYKIFEAYISSSNDYLATAHHENDQIETILKRTLTGSGPKGLSGIKTVRTFSKGHLIRPLLSTNKHELLDYAKATRILSWIEDPSNNDIHIERNFIRKKLLPIIEEFWPGYRSALQTFSSKQEDYYQLANEVAISDLNQQPSFPYSLDLEPIKHLSTLRKQNILAYWLNQNGIQSIPTTLLKEISKQLFDAKTDKQPMIQANALYQVGRYNNQAYIIKSNNGSNKSIIWSDLLFPCNISLSQSIIAKTGGCIRAPYDDEVISIRYREPGQSIHLANKTHQQSIKNLFQEWLIPPWHRNSIPFIYYNEACVCVVGYAICKGFIDQNNNGITFLLHDNSNLC